MIPDRETIPAIIDLTQKLIQNLERLFSSFPFQFSYGYFFKYSAKMFPVIAIFLDSNVLISCRLEDKDLIRSLGKQ